MQIHQTFFLKGKGNNISFTESKNLPKNPKPFEEWGLKMNTEGSPDSRKKRAVDDRTSFPAPIPEESNEVFEIFKNSESF